MPYGQYENTSFNGQTFTLGNVGLTGATGPDLVSSDPSKPVRVNGIVPGAGGGGGGDVFTSTNNTYDAGIVNTFQGNTVMTTVGASGKITCVALDAGNGKIETLADVECEGLNAGNAKIETQDNVECDTVIATANVECVDVVASGDVSCVGVAASAGVGAASLTTTGDINSGAGNIISGGTISGGSISTSSGSITSAGDVVATSGTGNIHGKSILSDTNISCGAGGNYFVGASQIASSNLFDVNNLLNTSATAQTKAGTLTATELTASNGAVKFTLGTGANIQNDTANGVLITSTTNATDGINWRLGTSGGDTLRLRYDANGGGASIPRYFLEMQDPSTSPPSYFQLSGNSAYDITGLVALINDSDLTFNGTTTTTFDAGNTTTFNNTVLLNGTTTVGSGVIDIGKTGVTYGVFGQLETLTAKFATPVFTGVTYEANYQDVANRFPLGVFLETYGTNTKVTIRGCFEYKPGGVGTNIPVGKFATLPSGAIPTRPVIVSVQGQIGFEQGRVDIDTNGDLIYQGGGAAFGIANLSQISFFVNV